MEARAVTDGEYTDYEILESDDIVTDQYSHRATDLLREFIQTYKSLPQLWQTSHSQYTDKRARYVALDKLVVIMRKIKQGANRLDVRKKINTLRSNFRKEFRKVQRKRANNEYYKPNSWVYYALQFVEADSQINPPPEVEKLIDNSIVCDESSNNDCDKIEMMCENSLEEEVLPNIVNIKTEVREIKSDATSSQMLSNMLTSKPATFPMVNSAPHFVISPISSANPKQDRSGKANTSDNQKNPVSKSKGPANALDSLPIIARVWGEKLQTLNPQQRIFAEKAINDVLFEASLGNLHRHSVKINEDPLH